MPIPRPAPATFPPSHNWFQFHDGRLAPAPAPTGRSESPLLEFLREMNFLHECSLNKGEVAIYADHDNDEPDVDAPPRWLLMIADSTTAAMILIDGWVDYFEAMRYFEPAIRVRALMHQQSRDGVDE